MTTINTEQDFLRALSDNPGWRDAVRAQLLGENLIQMPSKFDVFVEQIAAFVTEQKQFNAEQKQFNAEMTRFVEEQKQFNAEMAGFVAEQKQFNAEMTRFVEEQKQFNAEQREINTRLELRLDGLGRDVSELGDGLNVLNTNFGDLSHRVGRIGDDTARLKGHYAREATVRHAESIAIDLGLEYVRSLTSGELTKMVLKAAAGQALSRDYRSFRLADFIIEATDGENVHYIAVEASFTGDSRDTNRALRNASLLTQFTGCPSHAVIASVKNHGSINWQIKSGAVHWYQVDSDELEPE